MMKLLTFILQAVIFLIMGGFVALIYVSSIQQPIDVENYVMVAAFSLLMLATLVVVIAAVMGAWHNYKTGYVINTLVRL